VAHGCASVLPCRPPAGHRPWLVAFPGWLPSLASVVSAGRGRRFRPLVIDMTLCRVAARGDVRDGWDHSGMRAPAGLSPVAQRAAKVAAYSVPAYVVELDRSREVCGSRPDRMTAPAASLNARVRRHGRAGEREPDESGSATATGEPDAARPPSDVRVVVVRHRRGPALCHGPGWARGLAHDDRRLHEGHAPRPGAKDALRALVDGGVWDAMGPEAVSGASDAPPFEPSTGAKNPAVAGLSQDGRGGFRTCDLSRVKRALSH
jgi:hypothetical protein